MSNKIGRYEILSELAHSEHGSVYKATDTEGGQTVALKTLKLELPGEQAAEIVKAVMDEAQASKILNSHNIAALQAAEEVDGMLCVAMEYVQGNSIATMLARKEGFSIWDLMDIARQTCQGLDHAHAKGIVHRSLEPAKIMVAWDGTVKILSFGASAMSTTGLQAPGKAAEVLHYMSPEQLRGEAIDARSNLFSLAAIFYEMVTERKAFDGEDAEQVQQSIREMTPVAADQVNRKIHPALSEVIMKALAKSAEERYHSGQDLVNDLERCKESATKTSAPKPAPTPKAPVAHKAAPVAPARPAAPATPARAEAKPAVKPAPAATRAAAAGAGMSGSPTSSARAVPGAPPESTTVVSQMGSGATGKASAEPGLMSSAETETVEPEAQAPRIAVDPMMDENRQSAASATRSFSEIDELPPLKEIYVAPPTPKQPETEQAGVGFPQGTVHAPAPEKPRVQPREVAKKAVGEIKKTPPQLFLYSVAGAVAIMLLIIAAIAYHIHSGSDDDSTPAQPVATTAPQDSGTASATPPAAAAQAAAPAPAAQAQAAPEPEIEPTPAVSVQPKYNGKKKAKAPTPRAPAIVSGTLSVTSNPAGAQIQLDGQSAVAGTTPFDLQGLAPGHHTVTFTKPGYASESRAVEVASGSKSFMSVQLAVLAATVSANSEPSGAEVWMDGKNTGRITPVQLTVDKPGNHSFVFKKQGYLDESTTANLQTGQTTHLAPSLRALGQTDEIKFGGKFKKVFGGGDTAGMGSVSVKTQPKGAQIAVNNRILDKLSPAEFYLNPGNYVVDVTLSGFRNVHKVITVEKSGKVVIDENMDRE